MMAMACRHMQTCNQQCTRPEQLQCTQTRLSWAAS